MGRGKMTDHTPTPWRVEQDTDLIWGACNPDDKSSYGMGYAIVEGKSGEKYSRYKPEMDERMANAAFIVKAVNNHDALVKALRESAADIVGSCKNPEDPYIAEALRRIGDVLADVSGGKQP